MGVCLLILDERDGWGGLFLKPRERRNTWFQKKRGLELGSAWKSNNAKRAIRTISCPIFRHLLVSGHGATFKLNIGYEFWVCFKVSRVYLP